MNKMYRVVLKLTSYGYYDCEAVSKQDAMNQAFVADKNGEVMYGDQEMEIVESRIMNKDDRPLPGRIK